MLAGQVGAVLEVPRAPVRQADSNFRQEPDKNRRCCGCSQLRNHLQ